jgi:hypothetical protein
LDPIDHPEDPDYDQAQLWDNVGDADYYNDIRESLSTKRRYKALYYENIRLWIVQNPTPGERDLVVMEITLKSRSFSRRSGSPILANPADRDA